MLEPTSFARRAAAVGVGAFALWQFLFLPAANLMNLVPRTPGPVDLEYPRHLFQDYGRFSSNRSLQQAVDRTGAVLDFWAELSGQEQGWKLFVPGPPSHSHFPALEAHYADGSVLEARSDYEPTNLAHPAPRSPLIHNRIFNFELQVALPLSYCTPDALEQFPRFWSEEIPRSARSNESIIRAWLRWKLAAVRREHPDRGEPTHLILKGRFFPIPRPDGPRGWTAPVVERPYVRWDLHDPPPPGYLPISAYDPLTLALIPLCVEGNP